ncbi:MAG: Flp family type IVb pilin [Chloroflexi bacterium]|nr:Flp family type IVb pilin [Chloroflexota bacterium]
MDQLQPQIPPSRQRVRGQALVEYALILALLAVGLGFALAATGPALGNVFNNVVTNLIGANPSAATPLAAVGGNPNSFWQTVTWVAANPQGETPFPTPVNRPPTATPLSFVTLTPSPSFTPTYTPSFTPTPTYTLTPTNTLTPTPGPSETPTDADFAFPLVDQGGNPEWYRLDTSVALGTQPWTGVFYNDPSFGTPWSPQPPTLDDTSILDPFTGAELFGEPLPNYSAQRFEFDFGNGPAIGGMSSDGFSIRLNRSIFIDRRTQLRFRVDRHDPGHDDINIFVNGTPIFDDDVNTDGYALHTLPAGNHTLQVDYVDISGRARYRLDITRVQVTDDVVSANPGNPNPNNSAHTDCRWFDRSNGLTSSSNSRYWREASENRDAVAWVANRSCHLELRGSVDITTASNPQLSFWDMWDFTGHSGVSPIAWVEIAAYLDDGLQGLDRDNVTWHAIPLRDGDTLNFNWTRTTINIRDIPGLASASEITYRCRLASSSGAPLRWFIDDIQVSEGPPPAPAPQFHTVDDTWDLNSRGQMDDFFFNNDANLTLENNGRPVPNAWRWDMTSGNPRGGGGLSWEQSPSGQYAVFPSADFGTDAQRISYLEFRRPIDLTPANAPAADFEGDTGVPILGFWYAFDIEYEVSLQVQYTNVVDNATDNRPTVAAVPNPRNWQVIPNGGLLVNFQDPVGAPSVNEFVGPRTGQTTYRYAEIRLDQIPNWNTQQFYLRFAMIVNPDAATTGGGWWIDDIQVERDTLSQFSPYEFFDNAENATFTIRNWNLVGDWGRGTDRAGVNSTANAYLDSPGSNYANVSDSYMELNNVIDLLYDTPLNVNNAGTIGEPAARPPAVRPFLTFWHQRETDTNTTFTVEAWTTTTNTWTVIWEYDDDPNTRFQAAWERVEIDLRAAFDLIYGGTNVWPTLSSTADTEDDDIRLRIRLQSTASGNDDGVFVDDIRIGEIAEVVHQLWAAPVGGLVTNPGDNIYQDTIESFFGSPQVDPFNWDRRWHVQSSNGWEAITQPSEFIRNGTQALHESPHTPSGNIIEYGRNEDHILEIVPIIDLRGTDPNANPALRFWTRYEVGSNDEIRVQIATEDTTDFGTVQTLDNRAGWSAWQDVYPSGGPSGYASGDLFLRQTILRNTWERESVDLRHYVGERIKVRFVLNASDDNQFGDGWYIDNVSFEFGLQEIPWNPPFFDNASASNASVYWVTEGDWGVTEEFNRGTGAEINDFGTNPWIGWIYDCDGVFGQSCNSGGYNNIIVNNHPWTGPNVDYTMGPYSEADAIQYFWGGGRPDDENGSPSPTSYFDTFVARWDRDVTMLLGEYRFCTISDDGVRVVLDPPTGTDITNPNGYIINRWQNQAKALNCENVNVMVPSINAQLQLWFYENTGQADVSMSAVRINSGGSYTDSPNLYRPAGNCPSGTTFRSATGYCIIDSIPNGQSALVLNGYFNLDPPPAAPQLPGNPRLLFYRYSDFDGGRLYVEQSLNGGFDWTGLTNFNNDRMPPSNDWDLRGVGLTQEPQVIVRFRMDNSTNGDPGDGVYITDINLFFE